MDAPDPRTITAEAYRALELETGLRHEYINGVAYAMAGGTAEHSAIKTNLTIAVGLRLRGTPCRAADSDQKVFIPATGSYFYADLAVICGPYAYDPDDDHAITNPTVLIEVLSEMTADHDRGTKFEHYRRLPSVRWILLVSQDERRVEVRERVEEGWLIRDVTGDAVSLTEPDLTLPLDEVYDLDNLR